MIERAMNNTHALFVSDSGVAGVVHNTLFTAGFFAFAAAQLLKVFTHWYVHPLRAHPSAVTRQSVVGDRAA